jgi:hypothetical protein
MQSGRPSPAAAFSEPPRRLATPKNNKETTMFLMKRMIAVGATAATLAAYSALQPSPEGK